MTLLELLVVMVILAMVSTLLVQGMGSALVTYERVQRQQQQSMQPTLAYQWFSQTLTGLQAELDEPRFFSGNEHTLSGYTHRPLVGLPGQVSAFSWQLKQNEQRELELWYQQPALASQEVNWKILTWPPGTTGQFVYRALDGGATLSWPATTDQAIAKGTIPSVLFMEIRPTEGEALRWYISLPGRTWPRNDYRDF